MVKLYWNRQIGDTEAENIGSIMSTTAANEVSEEKEFNNTAGDKETSNEYSEIENTHTQIDRHTGVPI
jgi:hypothetical protein